MGIEIPLARSGCKRCDRGSLTVSRRDHSVAPPLLPWPVSPCLPMHRQVAPAVMRWWAAGITVVGECRSDRPRGVNLRGQGWARTSAGRPSPACDLRFMLYDARSATSASWVLFTTCAVRRGETPIARAHYSVGATSIWDGDFAVWRRQLERRRGESWLSAWGPHVIPDCRCLRHNGRVRFHRPSMGGILLGAAR